MGFAIAGVIIAVISAALSTFMAVRNSQQQAKLAKAVQEQKDEEAAAAQSQAAFDEKQQRRRNALLIAKQNAIFAASGVDTTEGTPLFTAIDSAQQAELDALNIRTQGQRQTAGLRFESSIAKFRRHQALSGIPFEIAGGVLSAASAATSAYGSYSGKKTNLSDWI